MTIERRRTAARHSGIAAASIILAMSPAAAAPENPYGGGTRLPQQVETINRGFHDARVELQLFARCTVKARPNDVQNYLLEDVGDRETAKLREKVLDTSCMQGMVGPDDVELHLVGLTLQGSLAEEMLAKQGMLAQPIDVASIAPLHHSDITPEDLKKADAAGRDLLIAQEYLFRFGECVVRADVADSFALLKTRLDSPDETAAFTRLMPAFGGCVEKNRKLTGDKIAIRAAIAYNYYKLAAAPRPASAGTVARH